LLWAAHADKPALVEVAGSLSKLGFRLVATAGTARALANARIAVEHVRKVTEPGGGATGGEPAGTAAALANAGSGVEHVRKVTEPGEGATVVDLVRRGHCDLVINTPFGDPGARSDGYLIREAALAARVPCGS